MNSQPVEGGDEHDFGIHPLLAPNLQPWSVDGTALKWFSR